MENKHTFRINLGNRQASNSIKDPYQKKIQNKIRRHHYIMEELLKLEDTEYQTKWMLDGQSASAEEYRKSMVPFYMID